MMSVSAVGWVLMAPWCASEIKFQDQKKKWEFSSRERKKINFLCFILASEFKLVSDGAGLSSVRVCDNWHLGFQVPSGGRRVYWFLRLPSSAPILGCLFNREEELLNGCFLVQNVSSRYTGISLSWSVSLYYTHTHTHMVLYILISREDVQIDNCFFNIELMFARWWLIINNRAHAVFNVPAEF